MAMPASLREQAATSMAFAVRMSLVRFKTTQRDYRSDECEWTEAGH